MILTRDRSNRKEIYMRYHNITKEDMLNGDGLRIVLWLAGCSPCLSGAARTR
ncbi:MAG: hypothetical protein ACLUAR_18540 [Pilosibacter sp.]